MEDDDSNGQPQDSVISPNKQPSSKSEAGSSKKRVPLQDQTLKENCPTDAKKRCNTRNGSKEMDENSLALSKKSKRKSQQNVSCPEIMSNSGEKPKRKRKVKMRRRS